MHERYYNELLKYFTHAVRDMHEAQDLVQATFERLLVKAGSGDPIRDERGLLYEIARNLLVDRYRQRQVRQHDSDEVLQDMQGPSSEDPQAIVSGRQRMLQLADAIEGLPPRCRQAFVLHRVDGLPQADVAQRMGISVNMVERHIMLALATCRKALGDERRQRQQSLPIPEPTGNSTCD